MASSEVDQKFLGKYAKAVEPENPFLSSVLFKLLGLSVLLSKKLLRARRLRKLDTTRDTKSLQLYHHIIWLSREGLVMLETYVLPLVQDYIELRVLAYKMRGSFYHIFVLFHNHPPINQTSVPTGLSSSSPSTTTEGGPVGGNQPPPGLGNTPISLPNPTASFLVPANNYLPMAQICFREAAALAHALLAGSHPLRLSIALEQAAFLYDCAKDANASRRVAKHAIADVYNAPEDMDDETFEDAAEMVRGLGVMMKRGLPSNSSRSRSRSASASTATTTTTTARASTRTPRAENLSGSTRVSPPSVPTLRRSKPSIRELGASQV
ncbi:14-3-3 protein [Xylona heveae TC161]|uniref:14-3-3 protein n=1 Tax=Xylona heveae (strain CBS 132557 / TC161) TaxID=1328760 RepID=A0A165JPL2_XYLHT|nr:14-3-3 protein [Xylona heveae TC161]KZF26487.1 14-3-3 protein [Xylona heveae TC161]